MSCWRKRADATGFVAPREARGTTTDTPARPRPAKQARIELGNISDQQTGSSHVMPPVRSRKMHWTL
jgi:hypothetical protein